jgi:hypothetical protein
MLLDTLKASVLCFFFHLLLLRFEYAYAYQQISSRFSWPSASAQHIPAAAAVGVHSPNAATAELLPMSIFWIRESSLSTICLFLMIRNQCGPMIHHIGE